MEDNEELEEEESEGEDIEESDVDEQNDGECLDKDEVWYGNDRAKRKIKKSGENASKNGLCDGISQKWIFTI